MHRNAVWYKTTWIAPGSKAFELFQAQDFQALDKHLKEVDNLERQRRAT